MKKCVRLAGRFLFFVILVSLGYAVGRVWEPTRDAFVFEPDHPNRKNQPTYVYYHDLRGFDRDDLLWADILGQEIDREYRKIINGQQKRGLIGDCFPYLAVENVFAVQYGLFPSEPGFVIHFPAASCYSTNGENADYKEDIVDFIPVSEFERWREEFDQIRSERASRGLETMAEYEARRQHFISTKARAYAEKGYALFRSIYRLHT